jgi:hypothetical protein
MKRPIKPFVVEIKRIRRSDRVGAVSEASLLDSADRGSNKSVPADQDDNLVVPAFLQTGQVARRFTGEEERRVAAAPQFSAGARTGWLDQPKLDQPKTDESLAPRVLQSLVPVALQEPAAPLTPAKKPRGPRRAFGADVDLAPLQKRTAARRLKPQLPAAFEAQAAFELNAFSSEADSGSDFKKSREQAAQVDSPAQHIRVALAHEPEEAGIFVSTEAIPAEPSIDRSEERSRRPRASVRHGRGDAGSLPPGQRWKRRLNPRAW